MGQELHLFFFQLTRKIKQIEEDYRSIQKIAIGVSTLQSRSQILYVKSGENNTKKEQQSHSHCREVQSVSRKVTPSTQGWLTWHPPGLCSALGWLAVITWVTRTCNSLPHLLEPDLTFLALLGEEGVGQELGRRAELLSSRAGVMGLICSRPKLSRSPRQL